MTLSKKELKKEKILDATMVLVAKNGLEETPISEIAKLANVATGTIYHHFDSKQKILEELFVLKRKDYSEILKKELNSDLSYKEQMKNLWMATYRYYRKNPTTFLFMEEVTRNSYLDFDIKKLSMSYFEEYFSFIEEAQNSGVFHKMKPWIMTELLHGSIATIVGILLYQNVDLSQEDVDSACEACWNMISKK